MLSNYVAGWYNEVMMKYKLCLIAGIMGIAVISGIIEALSAPRASKKEEKQEAGETQTPRPDSSGI